jgi:hypothetical protein
MIGDAEVGPHFAGYSCSVATGGLSAAVLAVMIGYLPVRRPFSYKRRSATCVSNRGNAQSSGSRRIQAEIGFDPVRRRRRDLRITPASDQAIERKWRFSLRNIDRQPIWAESRSSRRRASWWSIAAENAGISRSLAPGERCNYRENPGLDGAHPAGAYSADCGGVARRLRVGTSSSRQCRSG